MKTALNGWCFEGRLTFEEVFMAAKEAGFDGIELNIDKEGRSPHALTMQSTEADYAAIRALSEKYGLPVISIATSLSGGMSGTPEKHGEYLALLEKQLEAARALGAAGILTSPGGMSDTVSLDAARRATIGFFRANRDTLEGWRLKIGLENVWNGFFLSPYDMVSLIDAVGSPSIGAYFDAGNMLAFSDSHYWAEIVAPCTFFVHVKDFLRTVGINSGGSWVDVGEGSGVWEKIIPALSRGGFDGYLTGEVFNRAAEESWEDYYKKVSGQIRRLSALAES